MYDTKSATWDKQQNIQLGILSFDTVVHNFNNVSHQNSGDLAGTSISQSLHPQAKKSGEIKKPRPRRALDSESFSCLLQPCE